MRKRIILMGAAVLVIMVIVMTIANLDAFKKHDSSEQSITSASEAISAVKNSGTKSINSLDQLIASALGFKTFLEPQYGTSFAEQNSDGSWAVTIKGNMSGYVDDYHTEFESYKFEVSATVSEFGDVSHIDVDKVE